MHFPSLFLFSDFFHKGTTTLTARPVHFNVFCRQSLRTLKQSNWKLQFSLASDCWFVNSHSSIFVARNSLSWLNAAPKEKALFSGCFILSSFEHYSQATRKLSDFYWQFLPYDSTKVLFGSILNHTWSMIMVDLCDTDKSWKTGRIAKYKIWNTKYKARQSRLCEFVIVIEIITCSVFLVYFFGMLSDFSE